MLNYIKIKKNNEITDINLHNQIILISVFKEKKSKIYIYSYSLNGIQLGKMTEQLKMPISIKPDSDEIFIFGIFNIYLVKIIGAFFPAGRHANTPFRRFSVFSYPVYYNPKLLQSKPKYAIIVKN